MAERAPESPGAGDHKHLPEETAHDVDQSHEHGGVSVPDDEEDYPIERVEAVYRKLDLRIIPGLLLSLISFASECN